MINHYGVYLVDYESHTCKIIFKSDSINECIRTFITTLDKYPNANYVAITLENSVGAVDICVKKDNELKMSEDYLLSGPKYKSSEDFQKAWFICQTCEALKVRGLKKKGMKK